MDKRNFYIKKIDSGFRSVSIVVLIGARQVGKTTIAKSFKIDGDNLFLNGQDPEIAEVFQKLSTLETYLKAYLNPKLKGLLIIDEFQYIIGISTMLKILTDKHDGIKILCTGSSSLDILQRVEESLAGRVRVIEVFSLSFEEFLMFKDSKLAKLYSTFDENTENSALTAPFQALLLEYLTYGGLPRAALTDNPVEKIEVLNDIYQTYLLKDVRNYINNEHFVGFNKLVRLVAGQIGNLLNINHLSRETGLPYKKCEEYIYLLEQMYIIKLIEPYYTSKRKIVGKMKKVYFCDIGLRNIVYGSMVNATLRSDGGHIFENHVLLELSRRITAGNTISFYRTTDGVEVDFVIDRLTEKIAIECKFSQLKKPISIKALNNFCEMEGIGKKYIVNDNLNTVNNHTKLVQGYLVSKLF